MKKFISIFPMLLLAVIGSAEAQGSKSQAWMKFQNLTTQDTIATTGVDSLSYAIPAKNAYDSGVIQLIVSRIGATTLAGTAALWGSTDKGATWAVVPLNGTTTAQSYTITNSVTQSTFFHVSPFIYTNLRVVVTGSGSGSAKYKALLTAGSGG